MSATTATQVTTTNIFAEYRAARVALRTAVHHFMAARPADRPAIRAAEVYPASAAVDAVYDRMTEYERLNVAGV